jgi:hypothetical protein
MGRGTRPVRRGDPQAERRCCAEERGATKTETAQAFAGPHDPLGVVVLAWCCCRVEVLPTDPFATVVTPTDSACAQAPAVAALRCAAHALPPRFG